MNIKKLAKLHEQTETFLMDYASGKYGKYEKNIKVTETVVKKFIQKASQFDLEEALSYTRPDIIKDMLDKKGTDTEGASDLEDWIKHVLNKEKNDD
jgi:uncharacterized lipoprotein YajG